MNLPLTNNHETDQHKTDSPVFKFVVAFTAGISAVIFPRLSAAIGASQEVVKIDFFSGDFIGTALVLGILIGVAVMWMEWRVPEKPGHTFMLALGIPALFSGGFSTTSATNSFIAATQAKQGLVKELQDLEGIEIIDPTEPTSLEDIDLSPDTSFSIWPSSVAYAGQSVSNKTYIYHVEFNPGLQVEKDKVQYAIVLYSDQDKNKVKEKAASLKKSFSNISLKVMKTKKGEYLIIHGDNPLPKSEALLEAIRLKRIIKLSPHLLRVK